MPRTEKITTRRVTNEEAVIDKHIGNRIKLRRNLIGMSQEDLAERCGVTFQQVQKYEGGMNRVGGSRLFKIAHALNVDQNFFFEGLAASTDAVEHDPMKSSQSMELVHHFNRIATVDERTSEALLALIRCMSGDPRVAAIVTA